MRLYATEEDGSDGAELFRFLLAVSNEITYPSIVSVPTTNFVLSSMARMREAVKRVLSKAATQYSLLLVKASERYCPVLE